MYGSGSNILNEKTLPEGTLKLIECIKHSHGFTSRGRGTIKTKITYEVYIVFTDMRDELSQTLHWTTRKADANKIFKLVSKLGLPLYLKVVEDAGQLVSDMKLAGVK